MSLFNFKNKKKELSTNLDAPPIESLTDSTPEPPTLPSLDAIPPLDAPSPSPANDATLSAPIPPIEEPPKPSQDISEEILPPPKTDDLPSNVEVPLNVDPSHSSSSDIPPMPEGVISSESNNSQDETTSEDLSDDVVDSTEPEETISFETLPDFTEEDFSTSIPLKDVTTSRSKMNSDISKTSIPDSLSSNETKISSSLSPSDTRSSFVSSQGVFLAKKQYVVLLSTLKESLNDVQLLNRSQKQLLTFDLSAKKILDKEAVEFKKLHKDILAVVPLISKK